MRAIIKLAISVLFVAMLAALPGCGNSGSEDVIGGPLSMRRLTADQYRNAIEDAFGSTVDVSGRFEPDNRREGLNAIGTSLVSVTPSGFEQYEAMGRNIAAQVTSVQLREESLPCAPADSTTTDERCASETIQSVGRALLRRPLGDKEVSDRVSIATNIAKTNSDYYQGIQVALASLLVAPDFLFRVEQGTAAPTEKHPNKLVLTDNSLASRLSYFLWNRGPDEDLLAAAESGLLTSDEGLKQQVDRMLASDKLADGVRAFFADLLLFDQFETIGKDVARYPVYSHTMAMDAREQTLRYVVDHLVTRQADYPSLFTSTSLPMTRTLGPVYGLPVRAIEGWEESNMPARQNRAGLLSHASINMLHAHPGRSSPTLRGVFIREALLCQTIPEAPADVDFTQFSQDEQQEHNTARDRLQAHATQPSCEKCHRLTDPIGLGLEVFDGIGKFRTTENGALIDTNSDFDGHSFADPAGLGQAMAENPLVNACLVQNLYRYAVGREQTKSERRLLRSLEKKFEQVQYRLPALMREIAMSNGFRTASAEPETVTPTVSVDGKTGARNLAGVPPDKGKKGES